MATYRLVTVAIISKHLAVPVDNIEKNVITSVRTVITARDQGTNEYKLPAI